MPITAKDVTKIISEIYLYSVQDIQQTVTSLQEINLDCSGKTQELCLNCQTVAKKVLKNDSEVASLCNQACTCNIENINLNEIISVDMKNQSYNLSDDQLSNKIISILNANLKQSGDSSLAIPDTALVKSENIKTLNNQLKSSTFQNSVSGLSASQVISIKGAADITNVNMFSAINFVSNILQNTEQTETAINGLVSDLMISTTQVSEAGFATLIMWIVKFIIIFVFILALMATIDLSLQIYQKISD